jgi:hypothetical protein
MAPGTLCLVCLKGRCLPQNNAHLEHHPCPDRLTESRGVDCSVVIGAKHLIIAPLDIVASGAIFEITFDDVIKALRY